MGAGSKYEILVEHWGGEPGVANPFDVKGGGIVDHCGGRKVYHLA